ncbi:MAG: Asp-tRNA(Asn)/Glu-tRNA(Gln) amidotransferase A subunit family amidase, partial [Myxococcota bacterium]
MTELAFRTAGQLATAVREGEISSLELTDYFIARIEKY